MKSTVQQGKHDFKPSRIPFPRSRGFKFRFKPDSSCWYDSLGSDNYDFNKAVGLYKWFDFKKNKNALLLGFRPDLELQGNFQYVPYENINGVIVANEHLLVDSTEALEGEFKKTDKGLDLYLFDQLWYSSSHNYCLYGIIDTWFGGNNTAPQMMSVELEII